MNDIENNPSLEDLSRIEIDDFLSFLTRKKISSVCNDCGQGIFQIQAQTIDANSYLRLIELPIMNKGVSNSAQPVFLRICSNCFTIKAYGALSVYTDIVKHSSQGEGN